MRVGNRRGPVQEPPRRGGQMDRMGATVAGVAPPLDEPTHFEVVEESDHGVPVNRQQVGELLLRLPVRRGELGEQTKVPRLEAKRGKPGGEQLGRVKAHLGEQEPRTLGQGLRPELRHGLNYPRQ